jgi:hypothetical protein
VSDYIEIQTPLTAPPAEPIVSLSTLPRGGRVPRAGQPCASADAHTSPRCPLRVIVCDSIDQGDLETNLVCLPVFVAGCHTLLVLAGDTYFNRCADYS